MFITLSQDAQEWFRLAEPSSRANFISHPSKKAQNAWATKSKAHTTLPAKAAPISPTQGPAAPGPFPTQPHVTRGPSATQALQRGTETPVPLCASPLRTETHHPWEGRQILGLSTHLPSLGSRLWAQPKPSVPPAQLEAPHEVLPHTKPYHDLPRLTSPEPHETQMVLSFLSSPTPGRALLPHPKSANTGVAEGHNAPFLCSDNSSR